MAAKKILLQGITIDDFLSRIEKRININSISGTEDDVLTTESASRYLKLSMPTIYRLKAGNKIPFSKVGARVLYSKKELNKWLSTKGRKNSVNA